MTAAEVRIEAARVVGSGAVLVDNVTCRLGEHDVLRGIDLRVEAGSFVGILGPNGCGKTTLLRCIGGLRKPTSGAVWLDDRDISRMSPATRARHLALQTQEQAPALGYRVRDVVALGRLAHRPPLLAAKAREDERDDHIVTLWLKRFGLLPLADHPVEALSGGERQRVALARALAQEPRVLLLDEPTNHLDIQYRFSVLKQVRTLGITVLAVLHEIELAARTCDRIVLLHHGRVEADGTPEAALTGRSIEKVYGVQASIDRRPETRQFRIDLQPSPRGVLS